MPNVMTGQRARSLALPAELMSTTGYDRVMRNAAVVQQENGRGRFSRGVSGLGMTAQEIADLIKAGADATLPLIVAQNPGIYYTQNANGTMTLYHQPTGTTANLPGIYNGSVAGAGIPGAGGQIQTPLGTAEAHGFDMNTMMIAGLGLIAVLMLGRR